LDEVRLVEVLAETGALGIVGAQHRGEGPPPLMDGRLERAVRDEDAGWIGGLALRYRGQALAVGAEEVSRTGDVLALAGDRLRRRDATAAVGKADAAPASAVGIALALGRHGVAASARAVLSLA